MDDEILFTKIAALLIRDNKLLVVRGVKDDFYKALGGKVEGSETDIECLEREVMEEAQVKVTSSKFYFEIAKEPLPNRPGFLRLRFYFVEVEGTPTINPEDQTQEFYWLSKSEFETNKDLKIASGLALHAIPKLIEDGLMV